MIQNTLGNKKLMPNLTERIQAFLNPTIELASVRVRVDDSAGWTSLTGRPHDYDPSQVQEIYKDALTAWRKNPIAWRIVSITADYVIGDDLSIIGRTKAIDKFTRQFWNHSNNQMTLRISGMCEELSRAGDLFVALFRNPQDGMSYVRFVTKDRIEKIETAANDWEKELIYYETQTPEIRKPGTHRHTPKHQIKTPSCCTTPLTDLLALS